MSLHGDWRCSLSALDFLAERKCKKKKKKVVFVVGVARERAGYSESR